MNTIEQITQEFNKLQEYGATIEYNYNKDLLRHEFTVVTPNRTYAPNYIYDKRLSDEQYCSACLRRIVPVYKKAILG